ncbi:MULTISPECIES: homocysteine S-methyltransferase family protein [Paraburkholderia]|uniref:Homocysteine S-methyltransferase n=1 Tax=Paraburkholderia nemoris TaxID=2793076 RepID=A0ABM8SP29_9BURK|nr:MULTISPECIES: homocysteine S-methyltransferase family protein [Paraburkholderia]MBK5183292.1 homocysteine S-methyltransferase family protein [Burkholderia sp. R-69749]MBK3814785.1 homocysteine S-methyltransferase family protein [Paraburkholderia aspalathi]CAE6823072.1 Homocysteine S-methyltransferase [Paraburkholderia nemoris]CAE6835654.1 Homocysteine S-methyltransferase [Paraburkholderia nemoris]CAE6858802.1 Homocysteine S-methyltransferase [Paraburkholderia domus]
MAIRILDGGMGRELLRIGAPFQQPEWSALALIQAPEFVRTAHDSFVRAGADFITTNSYAVVPFHIGDERFKADGLRLAALAGQLARQAADAGGQAVQVAGSLPPVFGSYRPDLFDAAAAAPLLNTLVEGLAPYVDVWLGETLSSTAEAKAAHAALNGDPRPLWLSFTLDDTADVEAILRGDAAPSLRSGESIETAFAVAASLGAKAFLFNCSQAEIMEAAVRRARAAQAAAQADIALGVYANTFVPERQRGPANSGLSALREDLQPEGYAAFARRWAEAGASIIGGCCGIGPEHIALLSQAVRAEFH